MSEAAGHAYLKRHSLGGEALLFDLQEQAAAVINEAREAHTGHAARTLIKEGTLRMTVVGFKAGAALNEHRAGGVVSIEVLSGTVDLGVSGHSEQLKEHHALVLGSNVTHSVAARTDAAILLTISMPS